MTLGSAGCFPFTFMEVSMNLKTVMALAISVALAAPVLAQQAPRSYDSKDKQ